VLLADDEPLALRRLKLALSEMPDVQVVGAVGDGAQAINAIRELKPDAILLDIKMPIADGFAVVEANSFALRAIETPAVDYLLKPVEFDRLSAALNRARERRAALDAGRRAQELAAVLEALRSESHTREGHSYEREFWIRERGRFFRVPITAIERIEAERDYVRLHWEGRTLLYRETMTNLEERLDPNVMLRVHRSAFVNWARLKSVRRDLGGRMYAVLESGAEVPVSRAYVSRVLSELKVRPV
jgi:DNA-binding LytR/AlgR family response regulator